MSAPPNQHTHNQDGADGWGADRTASALAVVVGASDDIAYRKSVALQLWLFGYELPGVCVICCCCWASTASEQSERANERALTTTTLAITRPRRAHTTPPAQRR